MNNAENNNEAVLSKNSLLYSKSNQNSNINSQGTLNVIRQLDSFNHRK